MTPHRASQSAHSRILARFAALSLFLAALLFARAGISAPLHAAPPPDAPPVIGNWQGTISAGGQSLKLLIHVTQGKDGALSATMDSPDQGAMGIPLEKVTYTDAKLHYELAGAYPGSFDGAYDKAKDEISGNWKQAGQDLPLVFARVK